ncbi:short-chain dehydrogenase [Bartonella sp. DGB1]|uniref:short-chain dehydrogenase n=1 Tax=Bartonella sp. DGB1 TaxID=3239807 RepID=UPI003524B0B1
MRKMVSKNTSNYRYLVVGGTGMLVPLCEALGLDKVIIASRFLSNKSEIERLCMKAKCVYLDYYCETSRLQFVKDLGQWTDLEYFILWVHSSAHAFSCQLIDQISTWTRPPHIIHIFGSKAESVMIAEHARVNNISYTEVRLRRKILTSGWRWLTHQEISQQVLEALQTAGKH